MAEITAGVNWIAVAVGTVLSFALGAAWYSPKMFGEKWAAGVKMPSPGTDRPMAAMIVQFLATFLLAWIIGILAVANALLMAILVVLAIAVQMAGHSLFAGRSNYAIYAEAGYIAALAVIMIVCQAIL